MKKQTKQLNKIEQLKILLLILVGLLVLLLIFEYSRASLSSRHGEKWKDTRVDCLTSYRCPAEMCVLNLPASAKTQQEYDTCKLRISFCEERSPGEYCTLKILTKEYQWDTARYAQQTIVIPNATTKRDIFNGFFK